MANEINDDEEVIEQEEVVEQEDVAEHKKESTTSRKTAGRKREKPSEKEEPLSLQVIVDTINKTYDNAIAWLCSTDNGLGRISTGLYGLDKATAGGFPTGIPVILQGRKGSTKSSLAYRVAGNAFRDTGKPILLIYTEGTLRPSLPWLRACGLPEEVVIIDSFVEAESVIDMFKEFLASGEFSCLIIDSLAHLTPKSWLESKSGDSRSMGTKAKLFNDFFRQLPHFARKPYPLILFTQHIYNNIGPMGKMSGYRMSGGEGQEYASGLIVRLTRIDKGVRVFQGEDARKIEEPIYIDVKWSIEKTKTGGVQYSNGSFRFYLQDDIYPAATFSEAPEALNKALSAGLVRKSGAWYQYNGRKYQGADAILPVLNVQECFDAYEQSLEKARKQIRTRIIQESEKEVP